MGAFELLVPEAFFERGYSELVSEGSVFEDTHNSDLNAVCSSDGVSANLQQYSTDFIPSHSNGVGACSTAKPHEVDFPEAVKRDMIANKRHQNSSFGC
eukprot:c29819_g1_i1 orf=298-591(+)